MKIPSCIIIAAHLLLATDHQFTVSVSDNEFDLDETDHPNKRNYHRASLDKEIDVTNQQHDRDAEHRRQRGLRRGGRLRDSLGFVEAQAEAARGAAEKKATAAREAAREKTTTFVQRAPEKDGGQEEKMVGYVVLGGAVAAGIAGTLAAVAATAGLLTGGVLQYITDGDNQPTPAPTTQPPTKSPALAP